MSRTAGFDPVADGFPFPAAPELEPPWRDRWHAAFLAGVPEALVSLRRSFGGAIDLHDVPTWLTSPRMAHALTGAGWVFAALDYFRWRANPRGDRPTLRAYLQQRHLDCWRENGPSLLEWLAVQQQVPEEWLPRALIQRQLADRLQRQPAVDGVAVQIEMRLTPPGGARWLRDRSHDHWRRVGDRISAGDCCPVAAFTATGPRALLAFGSGGGVRCYDPSGPALITTIDPASVDGLLPLRYVPLKPPLSRGQRLADAVGLERIVWRLIRAWRTRASI